jgi:hypothetical protein
MRFSVNRLRRSAAGRAGAKARWAAVRAARAEEPIRQTRIDEITIRSSIRPQQILRVERQPAERGWSRAHVYVNGRRVGCRGYGRTALGKLLAEALA